MSGSFDAIARAILEQQQIMEKLKEENRELRRQLTELQTGHAIFVEIGGQRIALSQFMEEEASLTPSTENVAQAAEQMTKQVTKTEPEIAPSIVDSPTVATTPVATTEYLQPTDPRTPKFPETVPVTPGKRETEQKTPSTPNNEQKAPSTFLEEMMIDEFSAAMTSPMAVWTGPNKQPEITDEEKKAALRKELMGSFLLE